MNLVYFSSEFGKILFDPRPNRPLIFSQSVSLLVTTMTASLRIIIMTALKREQFLRYIPSLHSRLSVRKIVHNTRCVFDTLLTPSRLMLVTCIQALLSPTISTPNLQKLINSGSFNNTTYIFYIIYNECCTILTDKLNWKI